MRSPDSANSLSGIHDLGSLYLAFCEPILFKANTNLYLARVATSFALWIYLTYLARLVAVDAAGLNQTLYESKDVD